MMAESMEEEWMVEATAVARVVEMAVEMAAE